MCETDDSLSKANFLLESMLDLAHEPIDGRLVQHMLTNAENDGGQFRYRSFALFLHDRRC